LARGGGSEAERQAAGQALGWLNRAEQVLPGTRALQLPDTQLVSYFLDAFGRPERGQTCSCERQQEAMKTYRAPDWPTHFNIVEQWLETLS